MAKEKTTRFRSTRRSVWLICRNVIKMDRAASHKLSISLRTDVGSISVILTRRTGAVVP